MNYGYLWKVALLGFYDKCDVKCEREESMMTLSWTGQKEGRK